MQDIEIKPNTPIEALRKARIVSYCITRDRELHGMYEAENILCEWDWEDGWDLGDGYDKAQLETLAKVRNILRSALDY